MKQLKMVKTIIHSYSWLALVGLVMFGLKIFLMKELPVEEYALFDYSYGLMTLFCFIGTLGLPYITVRFIAQGYSPSSIKSHFFSITKYSFPLVLIIFLGLWHFTLGANYLTFLFASLGAIGLIVFNEYLAIFKGFQKFVTTGFKYKAYMLIAFSLLSAALLSFFNVNNASAILLLHLLILGLFIFFAKLNHKRISLEDGLKELGRRHFLFYGFSIFLLGMNGELIRNLDRIFVARVLDLNQLAVYLAAVVFVVPYVVLCNVIETVMFPYLKENLNLKRVMGLVASLAIMMNLLYFLWIEGIMKFLVRSGLLNPSYLDSVPIIKALSLGYSSLLIYAVSASVVIYSVSRRKLWKLFVWNFSLGTILAIFLNYVLIRNYGLIGAAYATDICLFVRVIIWNAYALPYLRFKKREPFATMVEAGDYRRVPAKAYSRVLGDNKTPNASLCPGE